MSDSVDWDGASEFFDDIATLIRDPKRVVEDAKEKGKDRPLSAATWMALGKYLSIAGRQDSMLCKTRGIEPQHPREAYCELALEVFSMAAAAEDGDPSLRSTAEIRIVVCLGELGRREEAQAFVDEHSREHPDDPEWALTKAAFAAGEEAELSALRELHSYLPAYSDEFDRTAATQLTRSLSNGLAKRASKTLADGNPDSAIALIREVLELDPQCVLAAYVIATACWHQEPEDLPGAERWFARCTELEPENADNWGYLASVLYQQQKFAQALPAYEQALNCGAGDKEEHVRERIAELRRKTSQPTVSNQPVSEASGAGGRVENNDWQVAESLLEDLGRSTEAIISGMDIPDAEHALEGLLTDAGTATLLARQMAKLQAQGVNVSPIQERYLHYLGHAATKIASRFDSIDSPGDGLHSHIRSRIEHWGSRAVHWLTVANSLKEGGPSRQARYVTLGYAYEALGRSEDAREAYERAEAGDDPDLTVKAAKAKLALDAKTKR